MPIIATLGIVLGTQLLPDGRLQVTEQTIPTAVYACIGCIQGPVTTRKTFVAKDGLIVLEKKEELRETTQSEWIEVKQ